ncbi:MAG: hypothetical protein JWN39_138, partial [Ilumatobacteraceae bacterium]|nr:hypothetical protein [Ilumatobacteraceae bacterium]
VELGRASALIGDVDGARRAWTAATLLDPDDATARELLDSLDAHG